jgi:transposase-like protein
MGYRRRNAVAYSNKVRAEVMKALSEGMSASKASQVYNISQQTINNWRKNPDRYLNGSWSEYRAHDIEEKVEVLRLIEMGTQSIRQIARARGLSQNTICRWIKEKKHILAVYSTEGQHPATAVTWKPEPLEDKMARKEHPDTKAENKTLREENQYLKAKVAYLEKLMELSGTPAGEFKKKLDSKPSELSSNQEPDK